MIIKERGGFMLKEIEIKTLSRNQLINITSKINKLIRESQTKEGFAVIYTPHTTAGITINESADPDVQRDIINETSRIVPANSYYRHYEGNSDSHIKSSFFGASEYLIIDQGELLLGRWQAVYFCEFDGPRTRKVYIKVVEG